MKKIIGIGLALVLCLGLLCIPAIAEETTAALSGPEVVRAGNTITLTFRLGGTNIYGIEGKLTYNTDQLTLIGTKQAISSSWSVEFNGNKFVAYDDKMAAPIQSATNIFTVTFQVKQLDAGTNIRVSVEDLIASDGMADTAVAEVTYEVAVTAPLSTNASLGSLTVENATLSPAFDPSITNYTAKVPYSVSKLELDAKAADSKASVTVHNPELVAETTTGITITVKAENGNTKVYTIMVHREKDPNYQPSGNCYLSDLSVTDFRISPLFDKDVTNYILWLPYEVESVEVNATSEDRKAFVKVEGGDDLVAGADNEIIITCMAENGDMKVYTIIAKRAPAHDAPPTDSTAPTEPIPTNPPETAPIPPSQSDSTPQQTRPSGSSRPASSNSSGSNDSSSTDTIITILYCVICVFAAAGIVLCVLFVLGYNNRGKFSK